MVSIIFGCANANIPELLDDIVEWSKFKLNYGKNYGNPVEETKRRDIFARTVALINNHNSNPEITFTMGINQFSDLELEEFVDRISSNLTFPQLTPNPSHAAEGSNLRRKKRDTYTYQYINYRDLGQVTTVKDQGRCAASYAFAGVAALESLAIRKLGLPKATVNFSEQQILDCTYHLYQSKTFNKGCLGGHVNFVFQYAKSYTVVSDSLYSPYDQSSHKLCRTLQLPATGLVTSYEHVLVENEDHLAYLLNKYGPISVALSGGSTSFQSYKSGIFTSLPGCGTQINHAMLLVGIERLPDGPEYWVFKNSWGTSWGEQGYIKLKKGIGMFGMCSMTKEGVSFVI